MWHRVECLEDSLSINVSLICASYAEVFCSGLQQLLWQASPAFRDIVVGGSQDRRTQSLGVMQELLSSLPGLLLSLHAEDFIPLPCSGINGDHNAAEGGNGDKRGSVEKGKHVMNQNEEDGEDADDDDEDDEEEEASEDSDADAGETRAIRVADVMVPSMDTSTTIVHNDGGGGDGSSAAHVRASASRVHDRSAATTEATRCVWLEQLQFRVVSHYHPITPHCHHHQHYQRTHRHSLFEPILT